jgi:tetratricopeptide (TPR) repeat protein
MSKPGRNDPCPCGSGKKYKHCCLPRDAAEPGSSSLLTSPLVAPNPPLLLPPSGLEYDGWDDDSYDDYGPLDEAWEVVEEISLVDDPKEQVKLARDALKLSPDCAGAYYYLALNAPDPDAALAQIELALAAANRVLAPDTVESLAAGDWLDDEVDWGMVAIRLKADIELTSGRPEEAKATFRHLLALDPYDRKGAGGSLMMLHLTENENDHALAVAGSLVHPVAPLHEYGLAMLKYRNQGDTLFSRRQLAAAIFADPEIVHVLDSSLPASPPDFYRTIDGEPVQDRVSAVDSPQIQALGSIWRNEPGLSDWLRRVWELGPGCRFDPGTLGDGPLLAVSPYESWDYRTCPDCGRRTKTAHRTLVTALEPDEHVVHRAKGRYCGDCDIFIVLSDMLVSSIDSQSGGALKQRDFMPTGLVDEEVLRQRPEDFSPVDWALRHRTPLRGIRAYLESEKDWFETFTDNELEHILDGLGFPGTSEDLLKGIVG